MRWNVEGADAQSGEEKVLIVEADTREHAEAEARRRGLLVSSVRDATEFAGELAPLLPAAPEISYRNVNTPASEVPDYAGLRLGSSVLTIFALIYYAAGGSAILLGLLRFLGFPMPTVAMVFGVTGAPLIINGFISCMIGALLHAFGAAALALRDMARNSFLTADAIGRIS